MSTNIIVERVEVRLDDNVPECMDGIIQIGNVTVYFSTNTSKDHQELVDNEQFHTEEEMIKRVAERLNLNKNLIEIIA